MQLHPIQKRLIEYIGDNSLEGMSLREIGSAVGVAHPEQVAHHLRRLEEKGYIRRNEQSHSFNKLKSPTEEIVFLPLFGIAQCGPEDLFNEENHIEDIPLPTKALNITNPEDLFLVQAKGKSMEPKIYEGDLVVIRKQNDFNLSDICLVIHNDQPRIKRVIKTNNGYALFSINSSYKPIEVTNEDNIQVVGVVKNIISKTI